MGLSIVICQVAMQPEIGHRFVLRLVKVIQRFVRFLDGPKGPFNLALRARGRAAAVLASRDMGHEPDAKAFENILEDAATRDRAIVGIDRVGNSLNDLAAFGWLWSHRIEQEA